MWKLKCGDDGRNVWQFDESVPKDSKPALEQQTIFDRYESLPYDVKPIVTSDLIMRHYMNIDKTQPKIEKLYQFCDDKEMLSSSNILNSIINGIRFFQTIQAESGYQPNDYGGCMFLLPGFVITCYISETTIDKHRRNALIRYLSNRQNRDGGQGLHVEMTESTMFGSVLNYVALRILGLEKGNSVCIKARSFIQGNGGACSIPPQGKYQLAVLGCYEQDGFNSIFPEIWLLPEQLPIHPSRWQCHCRMVYLPMAYGYANRIVGKRTDLVEELRKELYVEPYDSIDWPKQRDAIFFRDEYNKPSILLKFLNLVANSQESCVPKFLRKHASDFILDYVNAEDEQTHYIDIGPVNKFLNSICVQHAYGNKSEKFKAHVDRFQDYLWLAEDGLKVQSYNGTQLQDCTFALMSLIESYDFFENFEFKHCLQRAYTYIDITQTTYDVDNRGKYYRHISKGGQPFSTKDHGWPIVDTTSHALEAILLCHENGIPESSEKRISDERLFNAVNILLSYKNSSGGYATYENRRASEQLEVLNPSGVFDRIMVDYDYTELTSSALQGLIRFQKHYPNHRAKEIRKAVDEGIQVIKSLQLKDGSWYGSQGICFTYGTQFAVRALVAAGMNKNTVVIQRACAFLLSKQKEDGGQGETFESSSKKVYTQRHESEVVNTSWALLTLMEAGYANESVLGRGIKFLINQQLSYGDYKQESLIGVFNSSCMISYSAYRNVFSIWAISKFYRLFRYKNKKNL